MREKKPNQLRVEERERQWNEMIHIKQVVVKVTAAAAVPSSELFKPKDRQRNNSINSGAAKRRE